MPYKRSANRAVGVIVLLLMTGLLALRWGEVSQAASLNGFGLSVLRAVGGGASPADVGRLLSTAPASPAVERMLGMLAVKEGKTQEADVRFTAALRNSVDAVPLVYAARPDSVALAREAYRLYPDSSYANMWLGDLIVKPSPDEALVLYRRAAALQPGDDLLWEKVAGLAYQQGDKAVALQASRRACDINRFRNDGACDRAGYLSYAVGDYQNVIYYFERASLPDNEDNWTLLIRAAQKLGRTEDAARYLLDARQRNPADYDKLLREQP